MKSIANFKLFGLKSARTAHTGNSARRRETTAPNPQILVSNNGPRREETAGAAS